MSTLRISPDVTFVIAAYNAAGTIASAVESALAQEHVSCEVIVVDDCSADRTSQVVAELYGQDPRVQLFTLGRNLGPGGARNVAIERANGRWIAMLDSDDMIYPDRTMCMITRAEETAADIAVDNLNVVYADGRPKETMFEREFLKARPRLSLADFIRSNVLFRSTFNFGYMKPMFRRGFLTAKNLTFRTDLKIGEDYHLLASALAAGGKCIVEPAAGYVYNIREGSISRVLELRHVDAMIAADRDFVQTMALPADARAAQAERERSLIEARHFLLLVDGIKKRAIGDVIKTALGCPSALKHLRMPIAARLKRLSEKITPVGISSRAKRQAAGFR